MKVGQLIRDLKQFPPDVDVILSRDEEGNGFRELYQIEIYHAEDEGRGNFEIEEPSTEKPANAVVLWPA